MIFKGGPNVLKPIDIHADFKKSFKGYNEEEVDAFVAKIITEYENVYKENEKLTAELEATRTEMKSYQNKEQDMMGMISLTKETVAEVKEVFNQQAEAVLEEANLQAKVIIDEAQVAARNEMRRSQEQVDDLTQKIKHLKYKEATFKKQMRIIMETFWAMLEEKSVIADDEELTKTKVYQEVAVNEEDEQDD